VRHERVAAAEAEGTDTTVAIDYTPVSSARNERARWYAREQQGVSDGHLLSLEHFAPAKAVPTRAAATKAADRALRTMSAMWFSWTRDAV
jgi:hypothetical protein